MPVNRQKYYYYTECSLHHLNNIIIIVTFLLACLWVIQKKAELESWIALLGIISMMLSKSTYILEKLGYDKNPLGKGVIGKGKCWISEGKEECKIKLPAKTDILSTKIDYIPTERVMAHITTDNYLIFKRREGESGYKLRVDYELIKKD